MFLLKSRKCSNLIAQTLIGCSLFLFQLLILNCNNPSLIVFGILLSDIIFSFPRRWIGWSLKSVIIGILNRVLYISGLILCGPIRTFALTVPLTVVSVSKLTLPYQNSLGHNKNRSESIKNSNQRGFVLICIGIILLAFFDYDEHFNNIHKASSFKHALHHLFHHFGMSDHKVGLILLLLFVFVNRTMPVDVTSQCIGNIALLATSFVGIILNFTSYDSLRTIPIAFIVGIFIFPLNKQYRRLCRFPQFSRITYISILFTGCIFQTFVIPINRHPITIACCLAFLFLMTGCGYLNSYCRYPDPGIERHSIFNDTVPQSRYFESQETLYAAIIEASKSSLQNVLKHQDSRTIFYFLCLNLSFTFVEMVYGVWTNSLGLLSDGFHMLFDCTALILGLYASVISRRSADKVYTYGYGRAEILAGYINGLFLVIVGVFVLIEAIGRIFHPPEIKSDQLLVVAVIGLIINLVGVYAFGHLHHGCGHSHHSHDRLHSHNVYAHGGNANDNLPMSSHSHNHHKLDDHKDNRPLDSHKDHQKRPCTHKPCTDNHVICEDVNSHCHHLSTDLQHDTFNKSKGCCSTNLGGYECHSTHNHTDNNANMKGVFLHVLADTLGSVGVIISSFLIRKYNWNIADPICSLFIAALILISVLPMLIEAAETICLRIPRSHEKQFFTCISKISRLPNVSTCQNASLWCLKSSQLVCSISITLSDTGIDFDKSKVVEIFNDFLPKNSHIYVQILTNDGIFNDGIRSFNSLIY